MSKKKEINPHCPVPRCGTKTPHTDNLTVQACVRQSPAEILNWTKRCIVELIQSVIDDVNKGRIFAYLTRWRDPEELYIRALYALFVAPPDHLPHIFSGDMPNGFGAMWKAVNDAIFGGKGILYKEQIDLSGKTFTAMGTLNQNAHNSFSTMLTTIGIVRAKPEEWQPQIKKHVEHWQKYVEYLNHIEGLFRDGRKLTDIKQAIINLHRSVEEWQEIAREQAKNPVPPVKLVRAAFLSKGAKWRYVVVDQPPTGEFRFRVHINEKRYFDLENMVVVRTGTEADMLAAFNFDLQSIQEEGWKLEDGTAVGAS